MQVLDEKYREQTQNCNILPVGNRYKKTFCSVKSILDSAKIVLEKYGLEGFSTRKVANAAGISVGNLHYHFSKKRDLLASLAGDIVDEYKGSLVELSGKDSCTPLNKLTEVLAFLDGTSSASTLRKLILELSLSQALQKDMKEYLIDLAKITTEIMAALFKEIDPECSECECREKALFVANAVCGDLMVFYTREAIETSESSFYKMLVGVAEMRYQLIT